MMKQQHILSLIPDYALALLTSHERQRVERHTATCAACRQALQRELALAPMVRGTLAVAAQPPANLRAFMPAIPQPGLWQRLGFTLPWSRQLAPVAAPVALFLVMLFVSAGFYLSEQRSIWPGPPPTSLAVTATMTNAPTATKAPTMTQTTREETAVIIQTAVATAPIQSPIAATPDPTPIAALPLKMTSN